MSKLSGFALIVAGVAAAAYVLPTSQENSATDLRLPDQASTLPPPAPAVASRAVALARLESAPVPSIVTPKTSEATAIKTGSVILPEVPKAVVPTLAAPQAAPQPIAPAPRTEVMSSADGAPTPPSAPLKIVVSKASSEMSRQQLAREIQVELKRVGCFDGNVSGEWTPAAKKGMKSFIDRINATLPIDEPDHILKTLVQGHPGSACGKTCPAGQSLSSDRCVPNAILAQKTQPKRRVPSRDDRDQAAVATAAKTSSEPAQRVALTPAPTAPAAKPTAQWETTVTAMAPLPIVPKVDALGSREELPGRMALSGPRTPQVEQSSLVSKPVVGADQQRSIPEVVAKKSESGEERARTATRTAALSKTTDEDEGVEAKAAPKPAPSSERAERSERRASPRPRVYYAPRPVVYYAPPRPTYYLQAPRERSRFNASIFSKLAREGK
jgi:hypothetical protein